MKWLLLLAECGSGRLLLKRRRLGECRLLLLLLWLCECRHGWLSESRLLLCLWRW